jgi:hypothetical protein
VLLIISEYYFFMVNRFKKKKLNFSILLIFLNMYLKIYKKNFKVKAKKTKEKQDFFFYSDIKGKESRKDDA